MAWWAWGLGWRYVYILIGCELYGGGTGCRGMIGVGGLGGGLGMEEGRGGEGEGLDLWWRLMNGSICFCEGSGC